MCPAIYKISDWLSNCENLAYPRKTISGKRAMLGPSKTPYPVTKQTLFHLANAQSNSVIQVYYLWFKWQNLHVMSPTLNGASFHQKGFDLSKVQRIQSNHLLFSNPPIKSDISDVLPYFENLSLKWVSRASRGSIEFHLTIGCSAIPQSITFSIFPLNIFYFCL